MDIRKMGSETRFSKIKYGQKFRFGNELYVKFDYNYALNSKQEKVEFTDQVLIIPYYES